MLEAGEHRLLPLDAEIRMQLHHDPEALEDLAPEAGGLRLERGEVGYGDAALGDDVEVDVRGILGPEVVVGGKEAAEPEEEDGPGEARPEIGEENMADPVLHDEAMEVLPRQEEGRFDASGIEAGRASVQYGAIPLHEDLLEK